MISIDFSGNINLFNAKGAYATLENIEDAELSARMDELVNKYSQLLIASEGRNVVGYLYRTDAFAVGSFGSSQQHHGGNRWQNLHQRH